MTISLSFRENKETDTNNARLPGIDIRLMYTKHGLWTDMKQWTFKIITETDMGVETHSMRIVIFAEYIIWLTAKQSFFLLMVSFKSIIGH